MTKRKLYNILRSGKTGQRVILPECQSVSMEYARGYLANEAARYPSDHLIVQDAQTREEVIDQPGNTEVSTS